MAEFETGFPSVRQIQRCVADKQGVEIKLLTGDIFLGTVLWQDPQCLCLADANGEQILLWRQAIAYHKAVTA
ncbi:MAG: RNA-binding protein hfq [Spirulina sp. DLM2.Bin59]|nr:MAG: RNA-binding protein hfq [Spirulina sp. DLM2.Bin59]